MRKRVYILAAVSLFILIGLVGLADLDRLASILKAASPTMVALSIASYTVAIVFFALIWHFLLKASGLTLGLTSNLKLVFSSVFFNVVTPTASYGGEAVRIYLLSKKFGLDAGRGAATIVAHRIIGTVSNSLGTLVLGIYLVLFYNLSLPLLTVILLVTFSSFFGFLILLYFGLRIEWSKGAFERIAGIISRFKSVSDAKKESFFSNLESYHEGLEVLLKSRLILMLSMILGLLAWFFVNLVAVFAYKAVGGALNTENFLLIFTFFSVSRLIPTGLPEFVGSKEAVLAGLYSAIGLPLSTSVAVTLLIRVATQLWMIILGGTVTLQLGVEGFRK